MLERKQKEMEFHNKREEERLTLSDEEYDRRHPNKKYYSIIRRSNEYFSEWVKRECAGKKVLDYCCGLGDVSLLLAKEGAAVHGIDISDESIKTCVKRACESGYQDICTFAVMDAEKLEFEDSSFDAIVCSGVLHHLDLKYAYPELSRVLKPDGRIICIEALGYNPLINWYRKKTMHLRTEWEADHILTLKEVRAAKPYFNNVNVRYFHLFTLGAVPFRGTGVFDIVLSIMEKVDLVALKIPLVRLMAWQMIFELSGPGAK